MQLANDDQEKRSDRSLIVKRNLMSGADILIAEYDRSVAQELKVRLEALGYRVIDIAYSAEEAIEKTGRLRPRLLLMNTRLKGIIDGLQTGNNVCEDQDIPVVYMVDFGSQATLRRVGATGPFGYIFRPFDEKQIYAIIEMALMRHQLERKLEQSRQWLNTTLTSIGDGVIATDEQGLVRFMNPVALEYTGWRHTEAIGVSLSAVFSFVDEHSHEPLDLFRSESRSPAVTAEKGFQGLLLPKDKAPVPVETKITSIKDGKGRIYGMVLIFRDVTRQREAMQEIKRQAKRAEALLQVASQLNSQLEVKTVLSTICKTANQALNASGTAVFLRGKQKETFQSMAASGQDPAFEMYEETALEIPKGLFEALLSAANPVVVVDDLQNSPTLTYFEPIRTLDIRTVALAALFRGDELIGCLISAFARQPRVPSEDEISLLKGLADQASSAIENAELFEQVRAGRERQRKLAKSLVEIQESERRNIAKELHDHLGQLLTGLQFMLESTKQQSSGKQRSDLEEIQNSVTDIIEQVREMSLNLRPSMLDDMGLAPTLKWHFERFTRQTGVSVDFYCDEILNRFPADIETAAFRIVQEALTNVARHARVKSVLVGLAIQQDTLWVEVVDKGRGFDAATVSERPSSGLGGMRERAELAGGYFLVRSVLEQGTQVIAALPIYETPLERRKNVRKSGINR
jgi:PAS domain S-box-containing protein